MVLVCSLHSPPCSSNPETLKIGPSLELSPLVSGAVFASLASVLFWKVPLCVTGLEENPEIQ